MKIAIISDSHENWDNLSKAIEFANEQGCEKMLFAGDLIAPPGVAVLEEFNGNIHFIWGNNEGERLGLVRKMDASEKITLEGDIYEGEVDGVKIFMNHYPRISELAAKSGEFDLCIFGHIHEYVEKKEGDTILLNPGEIQGIKGKPSFVIFDTEGRRVEKIDL